jgi:hypothetical protein
LETISSTCCRCFDAMGNGLLHISSLGHLANKPHPGALAALINHLAPKAQIWRCRAGRLEVPFTAGDDHLHRVSIQVPRTGFIPGLRAAIVALLANRNRERRVRSDSQVMNTRTEPIHHYSI